MPDRAAPMPLSSAENAPVAFVDPDARVDLDNCDREPIHIPGAIQPYGVLLALRPDTLEVVQASESSLEHLGIAAAALVGRSVAEVFGSDGASTIRRMLADGRARAFGDLTPHGAGATPLHASLHLSGGLALLELEPKSDYPPLSPDAMQTAMRTTIHRLELAESLADLADGVADEMRAITGFDRIWVYRFHPDWHGEIIGESRREDIETWKGMHYPASDIPAQARALFLRNWVRVIPDMGFTPSPLVPRDNPRDGSPLDLGNSLLRSVSPIHVQYLQNMGVTASLVISLIHRGQLWGLISGHHYSGAKRVPPAVRSLCEFLAQALSLQIGTTDRLEQREDELEVRATQSRLLEALDADAPVEQTLAANASLLLGTIRADGAAIVRDGDFTLVGETPPRADLEAIAAWVRARPDGIVATDRLPLALPLSPGAVAVASGLLAMPLSRDRRDMLLWFRRERRQTVRWAGDPRKPVVIAADGSRRLHPRGSFELWEEESRGTSCPWLGIEQEAARDLRRAILDVFIRKAEEIAELNEELYASNAQLLDSATELEAQADELLRQRAERETLLASERQARQDAERANKAKADFLAVMSHELRTPLNAIGGYAQLMSLGLRGHISADQDQDLERIQINQRHLLGLINSILNFSKLEAGAVQFRLAPVPLAPMIEGLDALVGPQLRAKSIGFTMQLPDEDVVVRADEEKLRQVLLNLLTNALKFTPEHGRVTISFARRSRDAAIVVRDTGRGIAAHQLESIFEPFVQVDRQVTPLNEQGVGLGLAISRELARGMGGDLTATSEPGVGSTFTVTVPLAD